METFKEYIEKLDKLEFEKMYENDFFPNLGKTRDELEAVFTVADTLRYLRENNISTKIFDSGLAFYSATTLQEHVLVSLQRVIFWAQKFKIQTKEKVKFLTEKLFVRQQT